MAVGTTEFLCWVEVNQLGSRVCGVGMFVSVRFLGVRHIFKKGHLWIDHTNMTGLAAVDL